MNPQLTGFDRLAEKPALLRLIKKVCAKVPKLRKPGDIQFILVSDAQIKKLHKDFLNDGTATDVITFQYPLLPTARASAGKRALAGSGKSAQKPDTDFPFGDIYISLDTARRQAKMAGHPFINEIAFLMVHGLLHLVGYDDHVPGNRRRMLELQARLIREFAPQFAPADVVPPRLTSRR